MQVNMYVCLCYAVCTAVCTAPCTCLTPEDTYAACDSRRGALQTYEQR